MTQKEAEEIRSTVLAGGWDAVRKDSRLTAIWQKQLEDKYDVQSIATHNGKITISNPKTGNHRTFRIKTQKDDAHFAPGERIVGLLIGSNNETDYQSFGFVKPGGKIVVWLKHRGTVFERYARMLMNLDQEIEKFGLKAQWSATCRKCNRELTTPESIESGIGPICQGR